MSMVMERNKKSSRTFTKLAPSAGVADPLVGSNQNRLRLEIAVKQPSSFLTGFVADLLQDPVTGTGTITQTGRQIQTQQGIWLSRFADQAIAVALDNIFIYDRLILTFEEHGDWMQGAFYFHATFFSVYAQVTETTAIIVG